MRGRSERRRLALTGTFALALHFDASAICHTSVSVSAVVCSTDGSVDLGAETASFDTLGRSVATALDTFVTGLALEEFAGTDQTGVLATVFHVPDVLATGGGLAQFEDGTGTNTSGGSVFDFLHTASTGFAANPATGTSATEVTTSTFVVRHVAAAFGQGSQLVHGTTDAAGGSVGTSLETASTGLALEEFAGADQTGVLATVFHVPEVLATGGGLLELEDGAGFDADRRSIASFLNAASTGLALEEFAGTDQAGILTAVFLVPEVFAARCRFLETENRTGPFTRTLVGTFDRDLCTFGNTGVGVGLAIGTTNGLVNSGADTSGVSFFHVQTKREHSEH